MFKNSPEVPSSNILQGLRMYAFELCLLQPAIDILSHFSLVLAVTKRASVLGALTACLGCALCPSRPHRAAAGTAIVQ